MENLFGLAQDALRERIGEIAPRPYHAGQIFRWIYARGVAEFASMTDLPRGLRAALEDRFRIRPPEVATVARSADGTSKYTLRLEDGELVETVRIPEARRLTICISSQVGCALGCRFCLTASMGLRRNLTPGEIVGQIWALRGRGDLPGGNFNVVLMGMGEPMHNLEAVMAAIAVLTHLDGFGLPWRRVTLSTAGHVAGIRQLAEYPSRPRLAVSLAATTDAQRDALMPINRRWPIRTLLEALREYPLRARERITFEYVLLDGVNDAPADAARLARLLHGIPAKVNLIRYNRTDQGEFAAPPEPRVRGFRDRLLDLGMPVSIRKRRGEDIFAACGQLALHGQDPGPAAATPLPAAGGTNP